MSLGVSRSGCHLRLEQRVCELLDLVAPREQRAPPVGDRFNAVVRAGELAVDGPGRVGVVAEVDGEQRAGAEVVAAVERPERRLERADDVAAALDLGRLPVLERAGRDLVDLGRQRLGVPEARERRPARREQLVLRDALERADDQPGRGSGRRRRR